MCSAINAIDMSALESLEVINERLCDMGVSFQLSEIKGPVMDQLRRSSFLEQFGGQVFISQFQALKALAPQIAFETLGQGSYRADSTVQFTRKTP